MCNICVEKNCASVGIKDLCTKLVWGVVKREKNCLLVSDHDEIWSTFFADAEPKLITERFECVGN